MEIVQPQAGSRRCLMVVDVQPATLDHAEAVAVADRIRRYVAAATYDAYVVASFSAPPDSMFGRQLGWTLAAEAAGPSDPAIAETIAATRRPALQVHKTWRSVLKCSGAGNVADFLDRHGIDEVHLVGFDVNDCVLASAYDVLDHGYFAFVIEECTGRTDADAAVTEAALTVLRKQRMTNRSTHLATASVRLDDDRVSSPC